MANRQNAALKLVGGIFTAVGLLFLGIGGAVGNRQYTILKHWPTVEAVVTKSQVTHHQSTNRKSTTTLYQAEIEFHYALNGKEYTTPSASPYSTSSYAEMKRKVDAYAPGTTHTPFVTIPLTRTTSALMSGSTLGSFFFPCFSAGWGSSFFWSVAAFWWDRGGHANSSAHRVAKGSRLARGSAQTARRPSPQTRPGLEPLWVNRRSNPTPIERL